MEIKLRARLSAYSKVDSFSASNSILPDTTLAGAEGSILGVGSQGKFTLFPTLSEEKIDSLFETQGPGVVQKSEIDSLFENSDQDPVVVNKDKINTLFETEEDPEVVGKDKIDTLFDESKEDTITRVSYAEIDSLFS